MQLKLFEHQKENIAHIQKHRSCAIFDSPGCGKTVSVIEATKANIGKKLIFAPKSILQPAWGEDMNKFFPSIDYVVATAKNRKEAFDIDADYYITNFDAADWVLKNINLSDFKTLILDESTYIKNPKAKRTKAIHQIASGMENRIIMTGTPMPNTVLDIWSQIYVVDRGQRLGDRYYDFQFRVAEPVRVGANIRAVKWEPKPGSTEAVSDMIEDITIRHELEDVIDMPEKIERTVSFEMNPNHERAYEKLKEDSIIEILNTVSITAVHAASLQNKLLQLTSGSVYRDDGPHLKFDSDRYELIMDLVDENKHPTIVACNWTHQIDELEKLSSKRGIAYRTISGKTSDADRNIAVQAIQAGTTRVLFANIAALSHGVTLTGATRCIFASPTFNSEQFEQFKHRIFRAGQSKRTETILIQAKDTLEEKVYQKLQGKLSNQTTLLNLLK